jgi:hypothetical protein
MKRFSRGNVKVYIRNENVYIITVARMWKRAFPLGRTQE